eukprot:CAMPEP_0202921352 /NCGR_PEP_ID=MMETSP1392-20130828/77349_1 /ASSEMBLY_ACC=CAM_ASM_000868 /TAXON_ID=225041 /ORGANISM="Chlamydomonas chlamydogama, Strain SAG 11-48b" /LENGTH=124 /DNA_ID=CAMNT_0049614917 /DNA_START=1113 /DNA_END=1487 /DNA_ORIENTATION=+
MVVQSAPGQGCAVVVNEGLPDVKAQIKMQLAVLQHCSERAGCHKLLHLRGPWHNAALSILCMCTPECAQVWQTHHHHDQGLIADVCKGTAQVEGLQPGAYLQQGQQTHGAVIQSTTKALGAGSL